MVKQIASSKGEGAKETRKERGETPEKKNKKRPKEMKNVTRGKASENP